MNIVNLLPLQPEEKISAMIRLEDQTEGQYLCMITKNGIIKRTRLDAYSNVRKSGLIAIDLDEGDELCRVLTTDGSRQLLVATKKGMAIRFDENGARAIGRTARGVKALNLADDDTVVGMELVDDDRLLLTVTETGFGRLSRFSDYRTQSRGGKGLTNYHTEKYGDVVGIMTVDPEADDLILISSGGIIIRMAMDEIRLCSRTSKGVRVMRVPEGTAIVSIASAEHDENEVNAHAEETENADEGAEETVEEEVTTE